MKYLNLNHGSEILSNFLKLSWLVMLGLDPKTNLSIVPHLACVLAIKCYKNVDQTKLCMI